MTPSLALAALLLCPQPAATQAPVFDAHVHLWNGEASIREYEAQLKNARLEVTGFGGMWFGGPNAAPQGQNERTRASNDNLIELAARHPNMLAVATVHPYDGQAALAELQRIASLHVRVVKLHPHTQRFDVTDSRVLELVERAGELGVIILLDNANILPGDSENLFNLALRASRTKFIFAHMGGMNFRFWNILAAARTAKGLFAHNMYFDISAVVTLAADSPIEEEFVWTIRNVGIDNVILGSDYPQYSLAQTLNALDRLSLNESERSKIRYENARMLFRLVGC